MNYPGKKKHQSKGHNKRMHEKLQVTDVAPAASLLANVDHKRMELSVLRLVGLREI